MIPPSPAAPERGAPWARSWSLPAAAFAATLLVTLAAYRETLASLVQVWGNSATFAHGFLILPISGCLIWLNRGALRSLTPRPYPPALLLLPLLGVAWLTGHATGTLAVEHFSLVAMLPALVLAFFGPEVARSQAFPLGFLFFAVPFGQGLQPWLMDFTADFVVRALQISGVPVVRDGLYFAVPGARWRIVEACSGLNFLIAGLALACLYSYWAYRKIWKGVVFAACSIAATVLANGIRAYAIVLVGYLSRMRLGMGFEHNAIGWLVFMIVMGALFAAGSVFRDPEPLAETAPGPALVGGSAPASARPGRWILRAGIAAVTLGIWPLLLPCLSRAWPERPTTPIAASEPRGGWSLAPDMPPVWKPAYVGAVSETTRSYTKGGATVQCYLAFYERQRPGRELIQFQNVIVTRSDPRWQMLGERNRQIRWNGERLAVRETDVRDSSARFVVWHWFWAPDEFTASPEWAKVLQARASLLLRRDHAAVVVLAATEGEGRDASKDLRQFVEEMLPSVRNSLRKADQSR